MKLAGALLLGLGVGLLFMALISDTSISTSGSMYGGLPSSVNNIGLLQRQMMFLHTGLASIIAGTLFLVGGLLEDAIRQRPGASPDSDATMDPKSPAVLSQDPARTVPPAEDHAVEEGKMWIAGGIGALFLIIVAILIARAAGSNEQGRAINTAISDELMVSDNILDDTSGGVDTDLNVDALDVPADPESPANAVE